MNFDKNREKRKSESFGIWIDLEVIIAFIYLSKTNQKVYRYFSSLDRFSYNSFIKTIQKQKKEMLSLTQIGRYSECNRERDRSRLGNSMKDFRNTGLDR